MNTPKQDGEENKSIVISSAGELTNKKEKKIHWSEENETILVEWCDIAQCYKWLYTRSHTKYATMHAWFTIPTIIFSTISGTASFAQASLPSEYQTYATLSIGTINILIGIFATVQQYLKISELNESHRVSAISWDKFSRNIRIELAKTPQERTDAGSFIKMCRQEFDRLMETSPTIPEKIVKEFIHRFKGKTEEEMNRYKNLKKPDICDTIITVNETRHKWYLEKHKKEENMETTANMERKYSFDSISENTLTKNEFANVILSSLKDVRNNTKNDIQKKIPTDDEYLTNIFKSKEQVIIGQNPTTNFIDDKNYYQEEEKKEMYEKKEKLKIKQLQIEKIQNYINGFFQVYERRPVKDEIYEQFKDEIDIEIFNDFLKTYSSDV